MVHVNFDTTITPNPFFRMRGWQHGAGFVDSKHYFDGMPYQRGFGSYKRQSGKGISNVLRSAWRFLAPVLKSIGQDAGKEALATGGRILNSLSADPADVRGVIKSNLKVGAKNIMRRTGEQLVQRGSGRRKRRSLNLNGSVQKRKRDVLGYLD